MKIQNEGKQLKISVIVSDLSSSGSGRWGGAVRPFLLARALEKLNYEVEILGLSFNNEKPQIQAQKLSIVAFPCQENFGIITAADRLLRKIDGDIIYTVKPKPTSFGLGLLKKIISRRPLILDIDDWELSWYGGDRWQYRPSLKQLAKDILKSDGGLRFPDHPLYLKWLEGLVKRADAVTIHNQFLQDRFGGVYVPNGKDTNLFCPEKYDPKNSKAKYNLTGYGILMFPGAPRPYKGLEDVLMALDILDRPDLKLVIVGGSPYDDYDNKLMEKWERWIIKLPKQPVENMPEIVSAADIIIVPQRNHPSAIAQFPLKLTDGMAMAKPILATKVGDIPKILGGTGYLVSPNSPVEIADRINWIFANLDVAKIQGQKARERCINLYSIERMSELLDGVINKVLA